MLRVILREPGIGLVALGYIFYNFSNAGVQAFIMPFMQRVHGLSLVEASAYFGLATGIGGVSPILFGLINDRAMRSGIEHAPVVAAWMVATTFVAGLAMAITGIVPLMVGCLILWQSLLIGMTVVVYSALLTITPPGMRGTLVAWMLVGSIPISVGSPRS